MRVILFDVDGTLIHAQGAGRRAMERALERHYGLGAAMHGAALAGKTDPMIVREALVRAGRLDGFDGTLSLEFRRIYADFLREELDAVTDFQVMPGVVELVGRLADNSEFLIGLATGNVEEGAWLKLERSGLRGHLTWGGFGSDAEDRTEVVRRAVERARERLGGRAITRTIVIGDTPSDILHGHRAGAETVAVATGSFTLADLQSHSPELAVSDLRPTRRLLEFLKG